MQDQTLSVSPLKVGQTVQVIGMTEEDECMSEIFVLIAREESELAVPLDQLECQSPDEATCQAVADWHYWLPRGYGYSIMTCRKRRQTSRGMM